MSTSSESLFLARQPVHDISGNRWGFKIFLHRPGASALPDNVFAASARAVLDGLPVLAGANTDQRLIIPFPGRLASKGAALALPSGPAVLEIMEARPPGPHVLSACRDMKEHGLSLGFRHFPRLYLFDHLLGLADTISACPSALSDVQLQRLVDEKQRFGFKLLAEAVEDDETLERSRDAGFDLFWGGAVSAPSMVEGRSFSTAEMTRLRVIRELFRDTWDIPAISRLVQADGALAYRLLAYLNSAWFTLGEPVESVNKALMLLGAKRLKHWLLLVVLADMAEQAGVEDVLLRMAERGRLLELLAQGPTCAPLHADAMFLLGSFSLLDELLRAPLADVLAELPVGSAIQRALLKRTGPCALWLSMCEALESGRFDNLRQRLDDLNVDPGLAASNHAEARQWAAQMLAR